MFTLWISDICSPCAESDSRTSEDTTERRSGILFVIWTISEEICGLWQSLQTTWKQFLLSSALPAVCFLLFYCLAFSLFVLPEVAVCWALRATVLTDCTWTVKQTEPRWSQQRQHGWPRWSEPICSAPTTPKTRTTSQPLKEFYNVCRDPEEIRLNPVFLTQIRVKIWIFWLLLLWFWRFFSFHLSLSD